MIQKNGVSPLNPESQGGKIKFKNFQIIIINKVTLYLKSNNLETHQIKKEKNMKKISIIALSLLCLLTLDVSVNKARANEELSKATGDMVSLPAPDKVGKVTLMQALSDRKSQRSFSDEAISLQDLSNLLWASYGVNRADGKRTVPTARNTQNADVFLADESGIWLYEAADNALKKVSDKDMTSSLKSPYALIYAADADYYGDVHVGSMYQNAALYGATADIASVVKQAGVKDAQKVLKDVLKAKQTVRIILNFGKEN